MGVTSTLFVLSCLLISAWGSASTGELCVVYYPKSLKFVKNVLPESYVSEVYSAALGMSIESTRFWDGLFVTDPFTTPEAVVEVNIQGVNSIGDDLKGIKFSLMQQPDDHQYVSDTYRTMEHRIKERFHSGNTIFHSTLSDEEDFPKAFNVLGAMENPKKHKEFKYLNRNVYEDKKFLNEMDTLSYVIYNIQEGAISADNKVDFYQFNITGLHLISDRYKSISPATLEEAQKLLIKQINELSDAFKKAYRDSVLVTVVTTDHAHKVRRPRSVSANVQRDNSKDHYIGDYPAIFNILLWFCVVFIFAMIAIVYAIMDMDPGRDSIIYRMTSTRKKDN